jgi:hypothetical protein
MKKINKQGEPVYVSSVKGKAVARYGSGTPGTRNLAVGARQTPTGYEWDEDAVVVIPRAEWTRYRKEYGRAIREGALKMRTAADHAAYLERQAKASKAPASEAPTLPPSPEEHVLGVSPGRLDAMATHGMASDPPTSGGDEPATAEVPSVDSGGESSGAPKRRRRKVGTGPLRGDDG